MIQKLRVYHIPQIDSGDIFYVPVESLVEAYKVISILSFYDLFQFSRNIKPDSCNSNGLEVLNEETGEWEQWELELEDGRYFDDVVKYFDDVASDKFEKYDQYLAGQVH